jgi:serine/threonine protein kinase
MMDHPNIAKVLDAGGTETGWPYFVMELVRGRRITEYCDEHKLPIAGRLKLFARVSEAIQHAIKRGSFTATSSRPISWSRCTTASRCQG